MRGIAVAVAVLVAVSAVGISLKGGVAEPQNFVLVQLPNGDARAPANVVVDESKLPAQLDITVTDGELLDAPILVDRAWLGGHFQYPALLGGKLFERNLGAAAYYATSATGLREGTTLRIENFEPETKSAESGYGSPDSIAFVDRPMSVRIVEEPTADNHGKMVLEFDDGNHEGQSIRYSVDWLQKYGFNDPTFLADDGTVVPARLENGAFVVEMPHFSLSTIVNGVELSIDEYVETAYVGETIPIVWHTDVGSVVSHSEIHWGANPALLTNFIAGEEVTGTITACPPTASCRQPHENATRAVLPSSGSPTTRYYSVHAVVDVTSILTPVQQVAVVVPIREPNAASNQAPSNGATGIGTSVAVAWEGSDPDGGTLKYDVYLGVQNPPRLYKANLTATTFTGTGLEPARTYYWRILTTDPQGLRSWGPTWNFATSPKMDLRPYASFTFQVNPVTRQVDFDASRSYDYDAEALSYSWDFGDGATGTGQILSHTYTAQGSYVVRLTVTETGGPPIHPASSENCVVVVLDVCVGGTQNDLGTGNDAPGENDADPCKDSSGMLLGLELTRGYLGTPASYVDVGSTLTATAVPADVNDCFRFWASPQPGSPSETTIRVLPGGSSQVSYKVCNIDMTCSAAFSSGSWSLAQGMPAGEYVLHASILPSAIGDQNYDFQVGTYRDYDRDWDFFRGYGEVYAGVSYNDWEEFTTSGLKWDDADSDTDYAEGMIDGYERAWGFNAANAADDGPFADYDDDGLPNRREFFYDACGVKPRFLEVLLEWDYMVGEHDGLGYHEHRVPFNDLIAMFSDRLQAPRSNTTGGLVLATTDDTLCGGRNTIYPHTTYLDYFGTIGNVRENNWMPEHRTEWMWLLVGHRAAGDPPGGTEFVGMTFSVGSNTATVFDGTADDLGATDRMRQTWVCHELGHAFGLDHPTNNNNPPATKATCMYQGAFERVGPTQGYASNNYGNGNPCRFSSYVNTGSIEWKYVVWFNDRARGVGNMCPP